MGVEYDDVTFTSSCSTSICLDMYMLHRHVRLPPVLMLTCYSVIFDSHPYWCIHVTASYSTPIRIDVYTLHRHIRLPSVLMYTSYSVIFDSHPYWCVHVTSSYSTPIRIDVYTLHRHIRLPSVVTDGSRTWRCNVYTSIRMGVEYDAVTCIHQYGWESNMTL
jgi:hypothetical protein